MNTTALSELVARYGQQHLLAHWNKLSVAEQQSLEEQIRAVDFEQLAKLRTGESKSVDWSQAAARAKSPPAVRLHEASRHAKEAIAAGERALRAGQVGAVLVAGGQGTRLGFDHPKGMYPIGPLSKNSSFLIIKKLLLP